MVRLMDEKPRSRDGYYLTGTGQLGCEWRIQRSSADGYYLS